MALGFGNFNLKEAGNKLKSLGKEAVEGASQLGEDIAKKAKDIDVSKLTEGAKENFEKLISSEKPQLFVELTPELSDTSRLEVYSAKNIIDLYEEIDIEELNISEKTVEVNFKTVKNQTGTFKATTVEELQVGLAEMFKDQIKVFTVQLIGTEEMSSFICLNLDEFNVKF